MKQQGINERTRADSLNRRIDDDDEISKEESVECSTKKSWWQRIKDDMACGIMCVAAVGGGVYGILVLCRDLGAPRSATAAMDECLDNDPDFLTRQRPYPLEDEEEFRARQWETCVYMRQFMYRHTLEAFLRSLRPMMGQFRPLTESTRPRSVRSQYAILLQHGTLHVIPGPVHDRRMVTAMCTFSLSLNQVMLTADNAGALHAYLRAG